MALKSASQGKDEITWERFKRVLGQCALSIEDKEFRALVMSCAGSAVGFINWHKFVRKFVTH